MDSISLQCIEEANSTDCLIRALIKFLENAQEDNDARFNWDPITFGFTVSIALVAAGFALITIVQAILVAGPGRRKSNSEAIGKWSKYTVRQWRFRDLGYLHIAKTPIRTIQNVMAYLEAAEQQAREGEERSYYTPKIPTKTSYHHSKSFAASAAKWLVFLGEVGLSDLELSGEALETWLADYLPSDLLAVPALIEVQTAYIFMSLFCKPFRVLNTDARYPVLIGKDFQFKVRQHPTLGSIGTFSKYHHGLQNALVKTVSSSALSVTIKQANGIIPVSTAPEEMESDTDQEKRAQRREMRRLAHVGVVGDIDITDSLNAAGSAKDKLSLAQFLECYRQYIATRDGKSPESPFAVGKMHEGFEDLLVAMARRKGYNKSYVEGMMAKSNFQLLIPQNVENAITNWLEEDNFLGPEAEIG
ncbi:hypothetical protein ACLX1H_000550 [Fusarium chlamydosporum]